VEGGVPPFGGFRPASIHTKNDALTVELGDFT
jgi:hypothetical protein